eukprot:4793695-Alexandrium_andersonii.AAC.1
MTCLPPQHGKRKSQARMITYRAPGVNEPPGVRPDPAKYAELDLYIAQSRWKHLIRKASPDAGPPLRSDNFPVLANVAARLSSCNERRQGQGR